jgi:RNA polymerase sigma-70 factor (ECF subfamily)
MCPTAPRHRAARGRPRPDLAERDRHLAALLAAAAQGDTTAFETFYDATYPYARALARRLLAGGDTDDLLADAYFEAWRKADAFDAGRGSAVSWLLTLVHSRALDLLRRRPRELGALSRVAAEDGDAAGTVLANVDGEPGERLWRREAGARLHVAVQSLSPSERWVLGLAYWREMSHAEIAAATGWPLGTVKSHLLRAQRRLREALSR